MTDPDYRALCAELVELCTPVDSIPQLAERLQKLNALAERARALLAEPEAEGPTDEELETFLVDVACQNGDMYYADPRVLARAVLARWGRPAAAPVAIPGEEYHEDMGPVTWWRLPVDEPPWVGTPNDSDWPGYHTHFTPAPTSPLNANALPTPEATND
jgi:hypothetical protein